MRMCFLWVDVFTTKEYRDVVIGQQPVSMSDILNRRIAGEIFITETGKTTYLRKGIVSLIR